MNDHDEQQYNDHKGGPSHASHDVGSSSMTGQQHPEHHSHRQPPGEINEDEGGGGDGGTRTDSSDLVVSQILAPPPPSTASVAALYDPLRILRRYLSFVVGAKNSAAAGQSDGEGGGAPPHPRQWDQQIDEILRVADFLLGSACVMHQPPTCDGSSTLGPSSSGSHLLDGALALLDACTSSAGGETNPIFASHSASSPSLPSSPSLITRVTSIPSGRFLYLIRKGSLSSQASPSSSASRRRLQNRRQEQDPSSCYLCLLPDEDDDDGEDQIEQEGVYYCSCRSFHGRGARASSSSSLAPPTVCKHLLALVLCQVLGVPLGLVDAASDEEFSHYVMSCLMAD